MRFQGGRFMMVLIAAVLLVVMAGCASVKTKTTESDAPLAVTLYVSYGYDPEPPHEPMVGLKAAGWNDMCGSAFCSGLKVERPEEGFYSSAHMDTIARQLRQMEEAGIGVVVISWWG